MTTHQEFSHQHPDPLRTVAASPRFWAVVLWACWAALAPAPASAQNCVFGFKPPELFVSSDGVVAEVDYFFTFGVGTMACPETVTAESTEPWVLVTPSDTGEFVGNNTFEFGLLIAVVPNTFLEPRQAEVELKAVPGGQVVATLNINQDPVGSVLFLSIDHLLLQVPPGGFRVTEQVLVVNKGSQALVIGGHVSATTIPGYDMPVPAVGVAPNNFLIGPGGARPLEITAPNSDLAFDSVGVFNTTVDVTGTAKGAEQETITVVMAVSDREGRLELSRTGLSFTGVSGGVPPPGLRVQAHNQSSFPIDLAVDVETLSGGDWLLINPTSNAVPVETRQLIDFIPDPSGLDPGVYYAQVTVSGTAAGEHVVGSPGVVTVAFVVAEADSDPGPIVNPTGLAFVAGEGANPQAVQITNLAGDPLAVEATVSNPEDGSIFSAGMTQFNVPAAETIQLMVTADPDSLAAGIYRGSLDLTFNGGSSDASVGLELIVPPGKAVTGLVAGVAKDGCLETELAPIFTTIGGGSTVPAGLPVPIDATVFSDCGFPKDFATVAVEFQGVTSPPLTLTGLGGGVYAGAWNAPEVSEEVTARLTVTVAVSDGTAGTFSQNVTLAPSADAPPRIFPGGVASSATFMRDPLAPGTIVSVFGENLSTALSTGFGEMARSLPLPRELADTEMWLGGVSMPLQFSREDQVNAILPVELADRVNESLPLVARRGTSLSFPENVVLSAAQPGAYTQDASGTGPGSILDLSFQVVTAGNPALPGEIVQVYCTGLGGVAPPVPSGEAATANPLSFTTEEITVTVGGRPAVIQFSGLAPGFAGLYQINIFVPDGLPPGPAQLVITANGQASPPVTIFIGAA